MPPIAGVGLSILPCYMVRAGDPLVRVLPDFGFRRSYWISSSKDMHRFPSLNRTWRFIVAACQEDSALFAGTAGTGGGLADAPGGSPASAVDEVGQQHGDAGDVGDRQQREQHQQDEGQAGAEDLLQ